MHLHIIVLEGGGDGRGKGKEERERWEVREIEKRKGVKAVTRTKFTAILKSHISKHEQMHSTIRKQQAELSKAVYPHLYV